MKCVAVGDVFITPDMMKLGIEAHKDIIEECEYFFFGVEDRKQMRDVVKGIEAGLRERFTMPEGLPEAIREAEILMVHLCPVTEALLNHAGKLKYILCNRGGFENIDVEAATARNISVITNPAHNANAVAEYTIGLIFSEIRNISRSHYSLKNGTWREKYPNSNGIIELKDLTVGIIGFGNVGQLVCEKLSGFGCNILIASLPGAPCDNPRINWDKTRFVQIKELIANSDIISLHARSEDNKVILGKEEFDMMKPSACFINTSRSYMVDYLALYEALKNQKIRGAAIDVFEKEPLPADYPLLQLDNITLTNHRGGDTLNSYADSPKMMLQSIDDWIKLQKIPRFLINMDALR